MDVGQRQRCIRDGSRQEVNNKRGKGWDCKEICRKAGVPVQVFTNRADEPGGSTLGNLQSHTLPIPMADIGLAQLAMHSAVETAAVADADHMINAVAEFYRVHLRALGDGTYTLE